MWSFWGNLTTYYGNFGPFGGKVDLVMFSDMGLLTLNPIFSAPNGQKLKISVPIRMRTSLESQKSPAFDTGAILVGFMVSQTWEHLFGTPCSSADSLSARPLTPPSSHADFYEPWRLGILLSALNAFDLASAAGILHE